jgi:hypothetical protein
MFDAIAAKYSGGGCQGKKRKSGAMAGVAADKEPTDEEFEAAQKRLAARKANPGASSENSAPPSSSSGKAKGKGRNG